MLFNHEYLVGIDITSQIEVTQEKVVKISKIAKKPKKNNSNKTNKNNKAHEKPQQPASKKIKSEYFDKPVKVSQPNLKRPSFLDHKNNDAEFSDDHILEKLFEE